MKKPSDEEVRRDKLRESIIGLGERSIRKSYYPELQQRIIELERANEELLKEIAERKRAEQVRDQLEIQLRQAQKMEAIGALAGGIAHDFNNILSAIIGYAELAQISAASQCSEGNCHVLTDLRGVLQAATRAKNLVKQILTFSRQQEGDRKPIELVAVVREGLKMLRSLIPQSIEIKEDIQVAEAMVVADSTQMHQIIMNLGTNAYHAMLESGGVLTAAMVKTFLAAEDPKIQNLHLEPGPYLILRISDNGIGMERPVMERIFDPYFTTKDKDRGTGMGLAVVHGIVKSHKGHISVYSEPGQGSTFKVYLPLAAEGSGEKKEEQDLRNYGGDERLLVVDDEKDVLSIEQRLLTGLGYQVTAVTRPLEALRLIREEPDRFDLVVTDMTMPSMNGAQLVKSILDICPDMPVVLCSGFSELMNETKARAIGVRQYVLKPVMRIEIAQAVRRALDE
ncbi:MAG: response regulator [Desulfobulbaceae bacterium]|nr:MAG: response regulator [Desulfobulbaceae bacterium]